MTSSTPLVPKPRSNICWYWCFENESNSSWNRKNNCTKIFSGTISLIIFSVVLAAVIVGVVLLLGFVSDLMISKSMCQTTNGVFPWYDCFKAGGSAFGWYMLNLFANLLEMGPIIFLGFAGILTVNWLPLKYTLIVILSIISFLHPIFFNSLLGWLWCTICPVWVCDKCQVNEFKDLFQMDCMSSGIFPLGLSIIALNFLVILFIWIYATCDKCCGELRKIQAEDHGKLIRVT
jgi:hypothetical protein